MRHGLPSPTLPLRWHPGPSDERAGQPRPPGGSTGPSIEVDRAVPTNHVPAAPGAPVVDVRVSARRRKTASAHWEGNRIVVVLPARLSRADRATMVDWLVERTLAKRPSATATDGDLAARASALADRFVDGVRATSVRWVTNQDQRWGSCTNLTGEIRLSHRLRAVPDWVLDATLVHELAHLVHPDHSPAFHALADRHPRQREAAVFLEGYSLGLGFTRSDAEKGAGG